jgi:hypothetical protein
MFGRRRDIQIPKVPVSGDKATQSWMTAVGSMLSKYIGGGSNDRLVSAGELIDAGLAGTGTGGFLTSPPRNLTKPPKVTGLTANGALASIFVGWHNPSFSNYGYTELWRADIDDIGQAFLIASTAVESYTDNVGSAATKYYWARAVSDQGVKGDFNAASGTKGTTSLDPDYVMQVLTSSTWKPNTTYYPFQYVRPTVENGFQYAAVDGGTSGSTEPTWPTTINATVNDGTIQWITVPVDARIPFVLGALEDGTPAVFMDTAYIKDATITSAKIKDLVADSITTGKLKANLQVLSKLWYGFSEFANGSQQTGFWLGVESGVPKFKIDTGAANGNKSLTYDGYDLKLTGDGLFDDIFVDSARFETISTNTISYNQRVVPSDYLAANGIGLNSNDYQGYLCATEQINKTAIATGAPYDIYILVGYALAVTGSGLFDVSCTNSIINAYNFKDKTTFLRFRDKKVSGICGINGFQMDGSLYSFFVIYISGMGQSSTYFAFNIKPHLSTIESGGTATISATVSGKTLTINCYKPVSGSASQFMFYFLDSDEALNYESSNKKVKVRMFAYYNRTYAGEPYLAYSSGVVPTIRLQIIKPEYLPVSLNSSDPLLV